MFSSLDEEIKFITKQTRSLHSELSKQTKKQLIYTQFSGKYILLSFDTAERLVEKSEFFFYTTNQSDWSLLLLGMVFLFFFYIHKIKVSFMFSGWAHGSSFSSFIY